MGRIFITGSSDGLGLLTAKELIHQGHQVVLHARNEDRARHAMLSAQSAEGVVIADLSTMAATIELASTVNASGPFDAVIHNAGINEVPSRSVSADGLPLLLVVNTLAPYILTCLLEKPKRLVYLSSSMHMGGNFQVDKSRATYSDTKLHDLLLSNAVARYWGDVYANAVDPGWVPTRMGGQGAPDSLREGYQTQVWLAASDEPEALISGRYLHHKQKARHLAAADDPYLQETFLKQCALLTGISLPV